MSRLYFVSLVAGLAALSSGSPVAQGRMSAAPRAAQARAQAADTVFGAEVLALGERIFQGKSGGGLCFSCHGANAKGMKKIAPDLTDANWLHGDGSFSFIVSTVERGVAKPKDASAPMPPKGGANLTADQVNAVAAFVWNLRNRK